MERKQKLEQGTKEGGGSREAEKREEIRDQFYVKDHSPLRRAILVKVGYPSPLFSLPPLSPCY